MHVSANWYPEIKDVFYVSLAILIISGTYSAWCYSRLYSLLARYGSSVILDVYKSAHMNSMNQNRYQRSPLVPYIHKKEFEKEARREIREAGRRAYKGQMIVWWIVIPAFLVTDFLWIYFIQPH